MNWPTKIFCVFVIAIVVSLAAMVSRQSMRSPREVLVEVQTELEGQNYDERALLRQLASALHRAESKDVALPNVRELCADLRLVRGQLLLAIGATVDARKDFETVLREYRPGDREVRRLLIETESSSGLLEQALGHLRELLRDEPDFGPAWVEVGKLERKVAEEILANCDEKLTVVLIEEDAAKATGILRSLAARDPLDPSRTTYIVALRELFPTSADESLGQILGLADQASEHLSRCREALVHSFQLSLNSQALRHYLGILEDSGRSNEALAVGCVIAHRGPALADPDSAGLLIRLLLERGEEANAALLASAWINGSTPLPVEFLRLACEALYQGNRWADLAKASHDMRSIGSIQDEYVRQLYIGLIWTLSSNKQPERALLALKLFARSTTIEPFEGGRALAWRTIAQLCRDSGDVTGEREALQAALAQKGSDEGPLWLRRAELQRAQANNGYRLPLESWARGMSHLPTRTDELFETFVELGEKALESEERSIDVLFADLQDRGASVPRRDYGPYVLYRIAQLYGEAEDPQGQANAARHLLGLLPNFIPALDEMIGAREALGDRAQYIELVLQRLTLTGLTDRSRELLDTISTEELTAKQLVQAMQADPRGTGRTVIANWLADNGRHNDALATLASGGDEGRSNEELLLGAELHMAEGDYRAALSWLDRIPSDSPLRDTTLRQAARAALLLGEGPEITRRVATLLAETELDPSELMEWIDGFIEHNKPKPAALVMERLPDGPSIDPGPLFLREIQVALLERDYPHADLLVERSAAFLPEGSYLGVRAFIGAERGDWQSVREDVNLLRETNLTADPFVTALIDLLSGNEAAAIESASFALSLAPDLPNWILLEATARLAIGQPIKPTPSLGSTGTEQTKLFLIGAAKKLDDPRRVAALLLLSRDPNFSPFVLGRLSSTPPRYRGTLWPLLLEADHLLEHEREREAADLYRRLLGMHNQCQPAWDALETLMIARYGGNLHPQLQRLKEQRLRAIAAADPAGAAATLLNSRELANTDDLAGALRLALEANRQSPDWLEARQAVADAQTRLEQWEPALESWKALVEESPEVDAARVVRGYLEALALASQTTPPAIDLETIRSELDELSLLFPLDPMVALALARLDLRQESRNSALALEHAWSRLERLREGAQARSLEELARGATAAWAQFYVDTDPDSSEAFLLSELSLQPGNVQLWQLLGRVHRDLGRFEDSYQVLASTSAMSPSAQVTAELARTMVARGASPRTVTQTLNQADNMTPGPRPLEHHVLAAESFLGEFREQSWETACVQLERLWNLREKLNDDASRMRLAELFSRALLLRDAEGDSARALDVLAEEYAHTEPPYQREHFEVLGGIARACEAISE